MVNRLWWKFFGRGLVNPVDDMFKREASATHPELLERAVRSVRRQRLRREIPDPCHHVQRGLPAHQQAAQGQREGHPVVQSRPAGVLTPEQMWDSLVSVYGREPAMPSGKLGRPLLVSQGGLPTTPRGEFVRYFLAEGTPPTDYTLGVPHALRLLNGLQFNDVDAL